MSHLLDLGKRQRLDFQQLLDSAFRPMLQRRLRVDILSMKQLSNDIIAVRYQATLVGHLLEVQLRAHVRNGKIVYFEYESVVFKSMERLNKFLTMYDEPSVTKNEKLPAFDTVFKDTFSPDGAFLTFPGACLESKAPVTIIDTRMRKVEGNL